MIRRVSAAFDKRDDLELSIEPSVSISEKIGLRGVRIECTR